MALPPPSDSNTEIKALHLCTNGLRNKIQWDIKEYLENHDVQVLAFCETRLDDKVPDADVSIDGFRLFRTDRDSHGGGVALYIRDNLEATKLPNRKPGVEMIWAEISQPGCKPLLVGCCYVRPMTDPIWGPILDEIRALETEGRDVLLMGNFNINWLEGCDINKYQIHPDYLPVLRSVTSRYGLTQIVKVPTWSGTCIDHIYTNVPDQCSPVETERFQLGDHLLLVVSVRRSLVQQTDETELTEMNARMDIDKDTDQ